MVPSLTISQKSIKTKSMTVSKDGDVLLHSNLVGFQSYLHNILCEYYLLFNPGEKSIGLAWTLVGYMCCLLKYLC